MLPFSPRQPSGRPLRILCLGAHSDDIEIGCGGTVLTARAAQPATEFRWVVWSAVGRRAAEARGSVRRFLGGDGVTRLALHGFRDGFFPTEYRPLKEAFAALADEFDPDLIFTHARADRHQDHRVVSDLTWTSFRRHLILEYEIPKWDGDLGQPNWFVPLTGATALRKARLLMQGFASQRGRDWFTTDAFLALLRLRGIECRAVGGYAEAFHLRKGLMSLAGVHGR